MRRSSLSCLGGAFVCLFGCLFICLYVFNYDFCMNTTDDLFKQFQRLRIQLSDYELNEVYPDTRSRDSDPNRSTEINGWDSTFGSTE